MNLVLYAGITLMVVGGIGAAVLAIMQKAKGESPASSSSGTQITFTSSTPAAPPPAAAPAASVAAPPPTSGPAASAAAPVVASPAAAASLAAPTETAPPAPPAPAPPAAPAVTFSELSKSTNAEFMMRRQGIVGLLEERYQVSELSGKASDLPWLQKLLDDGVITADSGSELDDLGVLFGDVLASELGLHWATITDAEGTDTVLRLGQTNLSLNAIPMIGNRLRRGETVELAGLLEGQRAALQQAAATAQ